MVLSVTCTEENPEGEATLAVTCPEDKQITLTGLGTLPPGCMVFECVECGVDAINLDPGTL